MKLFRIRTATQRNELINSRKNTTEFETLAEARTALLNKMNSLPVGSLGAIDKLHWTPIKMNIWDNCFGREKLECNGFVRLFPRNNL